jgi:hypothetical protein
VRKIHEAETRPWSEPRNAHTERASLLRFANRTRCASVHASQRQPQLVYVDVFPCECACTAYGRPFSPGMRAAQRLITDAAIRLR